MIVAAVILNSSVADVFGKVAPPNATPDVLSAPALPSSTFAVPKLAVVENELPS